MAKNSKRRALYSWHKEHGGQMVEFAGWEMPAAYERGILEEHLATRKYGGLFKISHMSRREWISLRVPPIRPSLDLKGE